MIVKQHWGQHENCDPCKWTSLSFGNDQPKTHQHKGDPWDGNPVQERILELQAQGAKVKAMELSVDGAQKDYDPSQ